MVEMEEIHQHHFELDKCDDIELKMRFNESQKVWKREVKEKMKKMKLQKGFNGRACVRCWFHLKKLVAMSNEHIKTCQFKNENHFTLNHVSLEFCDFCIIHKKFKDIQTMCNQRFMKKGHQSRSSASGRTKAESGELIETDNTEVLDL
jgi:hypothetical protein